MAHVLFMDIVAFSKLPMDQQYKVLSLLQEAVRNTQAFAHAYNDGSLISLATGNGMALVFFCDPEFPVRCAVELSRALRQAPEIKLRMGIHAGPVYRVADINAARNVAGGGINMAQRVMDCGDAGHILISNAVAEVLTQVSRWTKVFHDLGEVEVKHDVRVHIFNLYTDDAGNAELPQKVRAAQQAAQEERAKATRKRLALAIVAAGVVVVLSAGGLWHSRQSKRLTDKDTIVLSDFTNTTGDTVFDDTLRQGLSIQLEQSPFLKLISDGKVSQTLRLMGRPAGDRLTPEIAREICQRTGGKAMLTGSISGMGSQYVVGLKAVNCNTGDLLAETQERASGKEKVLKALDDAAVSLRSKLGESLSSVQKYATPLELTTTSLEALKAFSLGRRTRWAKGDAPSLPFFKRAVEIDPQLASAYVSMSFVYSNRGELGLVADNARKAYELREKVSEEERWGIEAIYYLNATGELEKAVQVYELWKQTYPRDNVPRTNLGATYVSLGNLEKAMTEEREAMRLEPNNVLNYVNLGNGYTSLNQLEEADAVYKKAEERNLEGEFLLQNRYLLAFLKHDTAQMAQMASAAMGKPGTEDLLLASQADTQAWSGKLKNARELTRRAMDSAQRNNSNETAATYQAVSALREVEAGHLKQARNDADAAMRLASKNRDVRVMAALALARAGDTMVAEKLAVDLKKTFPLDTLIQEYDLPIIHAAVCLRRQDPKRALELLEVTRTIELGQTMPVNVFLCPVYLRGQAYLMLHEGKPAAVEFKKFIDHYGLVANFPWGALARLGLARAYMLDAANDPATRDKARTFYQDFLSLWKDADRDLPALVQAKAEYAKL